MDERVALLERVIAAYARRYADIAVAIGEEMVAPAALSKDAQAAIGMWHLQTALETLKTYSFREQRGTTMLAKEPIGVCGVHHALELAYSPDHLQGGACTRSGLRDGAQAL